MRRAATALLLAMAIALGVPAAAQASFGFLPGAEGFETQAISFNVPVQQAGAHPEALNSHIGLDPSAAGELRDLRLHLPPGFLVNPTAVTECSAAAFGTPRNSPYEASASGESCPSSTQVGVARVDVGGTVRYFGVFNLIPAQGSTAAIGLSPFGVPLVFEAHLRESDYGFDLNLTQVPQGFELESLDLTLWGTPWLGEAPNPPQNTYNPGHNPQRGNCLNEQTGGSWGECFVFESTVAPAELIKSYLTIPTTPCGAPLAYSATAVSWGNAEAQASNSGPNLNNCNKPLTTPKVQLMTENAASRTGLVFNLDVASGGGILNPAGIARPAIKKAIVSLPEGLTINPSVGAGLGTCTEADFARESISSEEGAGCPNNSKIGAVTAEGEIGLNEPMHGSVYLAAPHANPFGTMIAVYIVARLPRRGLIFKSFGKIEPLEGSGRLTATFDELPRLLYTHFSLSLREGQRSVLISPPTCGTYTTDMSISSWAEPEVFRDEKNVFLINHGEDGGGCPGGGIPPFHPDLLAGSINPSPTAYTPFYLRMTRTNGEQEITGYSATFPPGMLGKIAGIPVCPDSALEAARNRGGVEELEHPDCPESSKIGRTMAGYGVGGTLAWAPGNLYLGGPYHGSNLSVVAVDSALVGPFDLGTVIVRSAVRVDPLTAQVSLDSAGSDPIPHILDGIPLHLSDIRVYVDRKNFMLNGTSCDPMQVSSLLAGAGADPFSTSDDTTATSTERYQLLGCSALGFKPNLTLRIGGSTKHGGFPSLRATYSPRAGDANLKAISVALPPAFFLAQQHLVTTCTRVQFAHSDCPAGSIYGHASAVTPLLEAPMEGNVYLRASLHTLPDLVADLHGRGIEIEVPARIDTSPKGGLRATFEGLPDAPVTKFTMDLPPGKRSLLNNAEALCGVTHRGNARFIGQDNATQILHPKILVKCKRGRHRKSKHR